MRKLLDYGYCKAAPVIEWMSHKWALVIMLRIEALCMENDSYGARFGELFVSIPGISEKMLASTLDYLETEGLVKRNAYGMFPPCVYYNITSVGESFLKEISYVIEWGHLHFEEIQQARANQHSV